MLHNCTFFYKILLIIITLATFQSINARSIRFVAARSTFSPKYFSNFTLTVCEGTLTTDMYIVKTLVPGFKAHLDFQLRLRNSQKYQSLFSNNFDVCGMVVSIRNSMFKKWFRSLMSYGNFMENCPVVPGHYYLHNWTMDQSQIPTYLYPGDYRIIGHGYYGKINTKSEDFVVDMAVDAKIS